MDWTMEDYGSKWSVSALRARVHSAMTLKTLRQVVSNASLRDDVLTFRETTSEPTFNEKLAETFGLPYVAVAERTVEFVDDDAKDLTRQQKQSAAFQALQALTVAQTIRNFDVAGIRFVRVAESEAMRVETSIGASFALKTHGIVAILQLTSSTKAAKAEKVLEKLSLPKNKNVSGLTAFDGFIALLFNPESADVITTTVTGDMERVTLFGNVFNPVYKPRDGLAVKLMDDNDYVTVGTSLTNDSKTPIEMDVDTAADAVTQAKWVASLFPSVRYIQFPMTAVSDRDLVLKMLQTADVIPADTSTPKVQRKYLRSPWSLEIPVHDGVRFECTKETVTSSSTKQEQDALFASLSTAYNLCGATDWFQSFIDKVRNGVPVAKKDAGSKKKTAQTVYTQAGVPDPSFRLPYVTSSLENKNLKKRQLAMGCDPRQCSRWFLDVYRDSAGTKKICAASLTMEVTLQDGSTMHGFEYVCSHVQPYGSKLFEDAVTRAKDANINIIRIQPVVPSLTESYKKWVLKAVGDDESKVHVATFIDEENEDTTFIWGDLSAPSPPDFSATVADIGTPAGKSYVRTFLKDPSKQDKPDWETTSAFVRTKIVKEENYDRRWEGQAWVPLLNDAAILSRVTSSVTYLKNLMTIFETESSSQFAYATAFEAVGDDTDYVADWRVLARYRDEAGSRLGAVAFVARSRVADSKEILSVALFDAVSIAALTELFNDVVAYANKFNMDTVRFRGLIRDKDESTAKDPISDKLFTQLAATRSFPLSMQSVQDDGEYETAYVIDLRPVEGAGAGAGTVSGGRARSVSPARPLRRPVRPGL
jgi:hypothetical protein